LVFYVAHTRFWVVPVSDANGRLTLWVGGTANRNRDAFEQRFQDLTQTIDEQLQALSEAPAQPRVVSIA